MTNGDDTKLTDKQQAFINAYLVCWNSAEAARRAGYSEKTARYIGRENLTKPNIAAEIKQRITEQTMTANAALARLSEQATADMSDFISIRAGMPFVDLDKAEAAGKLHLLKKFKNTDKGIEIELYDAQSALVHVLRELHLTAGEATDRSEHVITDNSERARRINEILDAARERRTEQTDQGNLVQ